MNNVEWMIWGIGCLTLLLALTLTGSGKVMGRAAIMYVICAAAGLAVTFFTTFSKMHLLWILPLSLIISAFIAIRLAARMMKSGLQQMATNPEFKQMLKDVVKQRAKKPDDKNPT